MHIFLTEEELAREKALFEPHSETYIALAGHRTYEIKDFVPIDTGDNDGIKPPPSC
jgi:hypothetical protein